MVGRAFLGAAVAMVSWTAQAEHAVAPEAELVPTVTQETCIVGDWGYDEVRSDCRLQVRAAPKPNPALKGICTIFYGVRTCY